MSHQPKRIQLTNGLTVSYSEAGPSDSPVVVFIHGFPLNKSMWNRQLQMLEKTHRAIAYDVRGHGASEAGEEPFSVEQFAQDLIHLIDGLGVGKAVVCGLSMGGYIALRAVQHYPDRFQALVLCDTQCMADTPEGKQKRMNAIEGLKKHGVDIYAAASLQNLFAEGSFSSQKDAVEAVRQMIVQTSTDSIIGTLLALASREETCTGLPQVKVPTLIVVGQEDKITPVVVAEAMQSRLPNARLVLIPDAGHLPNLENPALFNQALTSFLEELLPQTPPF